VADVRLGTSIAMARCGQFSIVTVFHFLAVRLGLQLQTQCNVWT